MKAIFMGTPDFAVPCLKAMIEKGYEVEAVVTQPDRPKGRGHKLMPPPVKEEAQKHNIEVLQPNRVKDPQFIETVRKINPDIIVVVAFGQILPKEILDIPHYGCINVHASLLPKYRGAAPINWSIINGETITGITTMYMDVGLDTGDMILRREVPITESDTAATLHDKLSELGANVLVETIEALVSGNAPRIPQNHELSTYAPMLTKALGKIDWTKDAVSIRNLIRGVTPWPGAYTTLEGKVMKIFDADILELKSINDNAGSIEKAKDEYILVKCGKGTLGIKELQFENEKRMSVEAYLRGHNIKEGIILE